MTQEQKNEAKQLFERGHRIFLKYYREFNLTGDYYEEQKTFENEEDDTYTCKEFENALGAATFAALVIGDTADEAIGEDNLSYDFVEWSDLPF